MSESTKPLRIAVEGCGHGTLDAIYSAVEKSRIVKGWDSVDLLIIGGDFQAVRNYKDLNVTAMPAKYRRLGDFHRYYYGKKVAPILTIFIGGNHEASNHLFELYYGGWVAPNIYYLGNANVLRLGSLKIAGLSGIWHKHDFRRPHFERLPYNSSTMRSIYHVRDLDVRKLLAYRSQVDIGLSHDWPQGIEWHGDHQSLFKVKPFFRKEAEDGELGNVAAKQIMDRLRPPHWFSAHLHWKYAAFKDYKSLAEQKPRPRPYPIRTGDRQAVSAWNNFHSDARATETAEDKSFAECVRERQEQAELSGQPVRSNFIFEETYRQVNIDGIKRDVVEEKDSTTQQSQDREPSAIPQVDGNCCSMSKKRSRRSNSPEDAQSHPLILSNPAEPSISHVDDTSIVANPDAIEIEMSDDEDEGVQTALLSKSAHHETLDGGKDAQSRVETVKSDVSADKEPPAVSEQVKPSNHDTVSNEMRAKLAALSTTFAEPEKIEVSPPLPHPEGITNDQTRFLALSKCESNRQFLQLLEIEPLSSEETCGHQAVKLEYDPEWLAILRVFASELSLGGSSKDTIPQHRGDTYYRDRILQEEKWVQNNIVDKGLLEIPENFERTATPDDPKDGNTMPREVTNPQTTRFCKLLGIENQFDISEEERDRRIAEGPPPERQHYANTNSRSGGHRGRGGYRGGNRGGSRGRGRGRW